MTRYWIALAAATALSTGLVGCGEADNTVVDTDTSVADMEVDLGDPMESREPAPVEVAGYDNLSPDGYCTAAGPQTPRDITFTAGTNMDDFLLAPPASEMNLCNIHTHTNAEHKGPGFSIGVGTGKHDGYKCDGTGDLSAAELTPYDGLDYGKVAPGDTIEVHWVHSTCDIQPGKGLGSCLSDTCEDPMLRVETQVFLVVNDRDAINFMDHVEVEQRGGLYQASEIPSGTGTPISFRGSTTGPDYNAKGVCSPMRVTWSVRPQCAKLDIASLDTWAEAGNVFKEDHSHGIRPLVTDPRLLSPIDN